MAKIQNHPIDSLPPFLLCEGILRFDRTECHIGAEEGCGIG